uniref:Uncharacterized protein n=1 Tax=Arundo donax TaxID=35708 RepID=A0A0A9D8A2_ARUDO
MKHLEHRLKVGRNPKVWMEPLHCHLDQWTHHPNQNHSNFTQHHLELSMTGGPSYTRNERGPQGSGGPHLWMYARKHTPHHHELWVEGRFDPKVIVYITWIYGPTSNSYK